MARASCIGPKAPAEVAQSVCVSCASDCLGIVHLRGWGSRLGVRSGGLELLSLKSEHCLCWFVVHVRQGRR
eukprot:4013136-Amphidinium_carterae.1